MSEFTLKQDSNATDNLLATIDLSALGATAELRYEGTSPITPTTQPNKLVLIPSAATGVTNAIDYSLVVNADKTFTATTLQNVSPSYPSKLTGNFVSSALGQVPASVFINELTLQPTSPQQPGGTGTGTGTSNEFLLFIDTQPGDSLLATFDLPNLNMVGELHVKKSTATPDSAPDTLILLDTSVPNAQPISYQLQLDNATDSFTATTSNPGSLPATLSGNFVSEQGADYPSKVVVNGLTITGTGTGTGSGTGTG